ncbi:hypothetical protein BsWGS_04350 [Bradybaena similaris]
MSFFTSQGSISYQPLNTVLEVEGGSKAKHRKGSGVKGKRLEELSRKKLCWICGDRASGYHYNALSCEGCKVFFRRSILQSAAYLCIFGGNCEMNMWTRHKCQACRLLRCREVGMNEKLFPEGEMPTVFSQYQVSLADRMSFVTSQGIISYQPLDTSGKDGEGSDAKHKKGSGMEGNSIEQKLCWICGDEATGYNYNALSCKSCNGFFRRSILKSAAYLCIFGGNCEMNMWTRHKCQACRLRRCREVGMNEKLLMVKYHEPVQQQENLANLSFVTSQGSIAYQRLDTGGKVEGGLDAKHRKASCMEGKSIEQELCRICGDKASGYHYSVLSCEGCKAFFRRCIINRTAYLCIYDGNCEMDIWMRRRCKSCRLRRCQEVGMNKECVLSEAPCKARDEYFDPMKKLTAEHRELVETLVALQDKYEFADQQSYEETLKHYDANKHDSLDAQTFLTSITSSFVLIAKLLVEFAKCMPGFLILSEDDQITLLKSSSTEVMSIRAARCYDIESRSIVFGNGQPCTVETMKAAGQDCYCKLLYEFCHNMASYKTDNAEYAMLTAICIFSERPGLEAKEKVEVIQSKYVEALQAYESAKRGHDRNAFACLLSRLTDLRTISIEHSKVLVELDLRKGGSDVPAIIKDIILFPSEGN